MGSLPGWVAPLLGLVVGAVLGSYTGRRMNFDPPSLFLPFVAAMAGIGFVAGLIVWLIDHQRKRQQRADDSRDGAEAEADDEQP